MSKTSGHAAADPGSNAGHALVLRQGFQRVLEAIHAGDLGAFRDAVKRLPGGADATEQLRQLKDNMGRSILHHAAQQGHTPICAELVEKLGMDVNDQDHAGESALALASATGRLDAVRYLLSKGARPNVRKEPDGTAPLHRAANASSAEAIDLLVAAGADVNMGSKTGTPLCWAAGSGQADNVERLLSLGADANPSTGSRASALLLAAASGCERAVTLLLAAGADPNHRAADGGATALHAVAAVDGDEDVAVRVAQALLDAGASADARDDAGLTPLVIAAARRRMRLVALLLPLSSPAASGLGEGVEWTPEGVAAAAQVHVEALGRAAAATPPSAASRAGHEPGKEVVALPDAPEPDDALAAECKRRGDEAFVRKDYAAAASHYSESLRHGTRSAAVWANRSMAYLRLDEPAKALEDARISRALDPTYVKAWYREGSAHAAMKRWEDAAVAFFEASGLDPKNQEVAKAFQDAIAEGRKESAALKASKG